MTPSTADVIVLSSSPNPPRSPGPGRYVINQGSVDSPRDATPPPIPSISDLSQPQTRSRFFPSPVASVKCPENVKKPKKRSTKKDITANSSGRTAPSKPRRKAKETAAAPEINATGEPQTESVATQNDAVKPTKRRTRKNGNTKDSGNMTLTGKVTKSGDLPANKSSKGGKKTVASKASSSENLSEKSASAESNVLGKDEALDLDEAMRRRMDWTPPRDTACEEVITMNDGSGQANTQDPKAMNGFGKLLSDYNYSGSVLNPRDLFQNTSEGGPTKRRRIELVNSEIQALLNARHFDSSDEPSAQEVSSAKPKKTTKSKPKKFTTLTARMTAQYSTNEVEEEEPVIDCIPDIRTKSRRRKAKETEEESPYTLLSPEAAAEYLNDQDLVFGTCSQLEKEDSPQTLKEIQQAIRASESFSRPEETRKKEFESTQLPSTRSVSKMASTKNLWCVGARDTEGSLVQSETLSVVDLTNAKEPNIQKNEEPVKSASHKSLQKDWFEFEFADIDSPPEKRPSSLPLAKKDSGLDRPVPAPALEAAAIVKATASKSGKRSQNTPAEVIKTQPIVLQAPPMPHYAGFTDAELSKQVSNYGFKAVRGRKKMIDLLQQCWESKHGTNAASDSTVSGESKVPLPSSDPKPKATAKSKSGSSTKNQKSLDTKKSTSTSQTNLQISPQKISQRKPFTGASTSFVDIEEIQDSEEEMIPSPSQVQKHYTDIYSKSKTSRQAQQDSLDIITKTPSPSPTKRKVVSSKASVKRPSSSTYIATTRTTESSKQISLAEISAQITHAVRVQPRLSLPSSSRGSRTRPTWHEKILMYDPIVLEDFTAWLNMEGLGLVGEDCEVGTAIVREWCESKGICCCWKKNASW
ncbi:hypothetical protein N7475_006110 [Penicillium sp. IBT 31633x]|nr:hypothetical protein N7475_006110 [Penicillium sp. IBT 31633x]